MRTEVAITIDTEFSIAGALTFQDRYQPISDQAVDCIVGDRSEGLGFILETLAQYGAYATFFVEALNHRFFGDEPMKRICHRLKAAGQDVQLHLHPCWLAYENGVRTGAPPNDNCAGRTVEDLVSIIQIGLTAFDRWGMARPAALRTGNFSVDDNVYRAMAKLNLPIASNVATAIAQPADQRLRVSNGRLLVHGVTEVPLTVFHDFNAFGKRHHRPLAITACGWPEMRTVLWRARRSGLQTVVILTHPFEFVKTRGYRFEHIVRNRVNQNRLESLCAFLAEHDQDFVPVTFGAQAPMWQDRGPIAPISLNGHPAQTLARVLENGLNDRIWSF